MDEKDRYVEVEEFRGVKIVLDKLIRSYRAQVEDISLRNNSWDDIREEIKEAQSKLRKQHEPVDMVLVVGRKMTPVRVHGIHQTQGILRVAPRVKFRDTMAFAMVRDPDVESEVKGVLGQLSSHEAKVSELTERLRAIRKEHGISVTFHGVNARNIYAEEQRLFAEIEAKQKQKEA